MSAVASPSRLSPFARPPQLADWLILTAIVVVSVAAAFPLAWMVLTSLKTPAETMQTPPVWIPATPSLAAYGKVSEVVQAGRSFVNSAIIATTTTAGILLTSLLAGFAFAKYEFRGREILFAIVIATMFLPPIVTLIPLYRLVGYLHIDGGLAGVIAPNLANAFGIFLMRQFIKGVPDDLVDAGRMDGASELRIVFLIVAPSVTPAIAALALFAFVYHWNSYLWPLTVLQGHSDQYPIVISLSRLLSYNRGALNTSLVMAGATHGCPPASGPVCVSAALLRRQHRQLGGQGMTAALCLDLGGTNFRAALAQVGREGDAVTLGHWPAPEDLAAFQRLVAGLIDAHTVSRVGIAVPGLASGSDMPLGAEPALSGRAGPGPSLPRHNRDARQRRPLRPSCRGGARRGAKRGGRHSFGNRDGDRFGGTRGWTDRTWGRRRGGLLRLGVRRSGRRRRRQPADGSSATRRERPLTQSAGAPD